MKRLSSIALAICFSILLVSGVYGEGITDARMSDAPNGPAMPKCDPDHPTLARLPSGTGTERTALVETPTATLVSAESPTPTFAETAAETPSPGPTDTPAAPELIVTTPEVAVTPPVGRITGGHVSDAHDGPEMIKFPSGTTTTFVIFEYADMEDEEIRVRVYDQVGNIVFEQAKSYTGSGSEYVAVSSPAGVFADGRYLTNLYLGGFLTRSIIWEVGEVVELPSPTPTATSQPRGIPPSVGIAVGLLLVLGTGWTIRRIRGAR